MNIAVIGTGHIGLTTGVAFADVGHDTTYINIEANHNDMKRLREGTVPFYEPDLELLLMKNMTADRFRMTDHLFEIEAEVLCLALDMPHEAELVALAEQVCEALPNCAVLMIKSTVLPGTCEALQEKLLAQGHRTEVVYSPHFMRKGSAVRDTFKADRILLGMSSHRVAEQMQRLHAAFDIPLYETTLRNAEMIKYATSAFLATKVSFINEIAQLCEGIGADIEAVTEGLSLDGRIGGAYLQAGIGYSGSGLAKDTSALAMLAHMNEIDMPVLKAVLEVNENQVQAFVEKAKDCGALKGKRVALLGLTYKANTDDLSETPALTVANTLLSEGAEVIGYDPVAIESAKKMMPNGVLFGRTIAETVNQCDLAMILTDGLEIEAFPLNDYKHFMKTPVLLDGRNVHCPVEAEGAGIHYISIGRNEVSDSFVP
ncbi:UDP-glucose dehydrogenase family protein [Aureibacillus halotolerans]|uniref:UDP-glucose 6-dehydrogenase n=1 Tax=Aureibacillus halotolerans TaxID=1508390 RepID=A0A4R6UIK4_9BACI|nr:nucleotide sugar dehydrogenase [Aureibacillus halotolerans]TDQ43004.1 UDPglucose 6-dehydrogenase [Aureibacillus halotolerans]